MQMTRRTFIGAAAAAGVLPARATAAVSGQAPRDRLDPWIEVEPAALAHNVSQVSRLSGRPILAVVKNDAYGLGLTVAAGILEPMQDILGFAVVRAAEAMALRDAGVQKRVLLMARAATGEVRELVERGIELALLNDDDATRFAEPARRAGSRIPAHFYIDTGMGRMGLRFDRALPWMRRIAESGAFEVRGTFTELTEEPEFDREQIRRFVGLTRSAGGAGVPLGRLHAASSNGVFHLPEAHLDVVRPGIALWGGYPSRPEEERAKAELRPAVRLCARVVRVERIEAGDGVSYGRNYIAQRPTWIATLPVGHVDGYPRVAVNGARVLVGGRLCPVIGAVSASHCIIEVGDDPAVVVGDVATFIGPDDPSIHPNSIAAATGASVYDLFMHLSPKLPRFIV